MNLNTWWFFIYQISAVTSTSNLFTKSIFFFYSSFPNSLFLYIPLFFLFLYLSSTVCPSFPAHVDEAMLRRHDSHDVIYGHLRCALQLCAAIFPACAKCEQPEQLQSWAEKCSFVHQVSSSTLIEWLCIFSLASFLPLYLSLSTSLPFMLSYLNTLFFSLNTVFFLSPSLSRWKVVYRYCGGSHYLYCKANIDIILLIEI